MPVRKKALVVCIGNALVGDDAFGPKVYETLIERGLPDDVDARLLGLGGIGLIDEMDGEDTLVVVDAVIFGTAPGTLHVVNWPDLKGAGGMPVTSHDVGLSEVMAVCARLFPERMPGKVILVGVEGRCFNQVGAPLTPAVCKAVPKAAEAVLSKCHAAG
jgi:hydrogenase maturation protease